MQDANKSTDKSKKSHSKQQGTMQKETICPPACGKPGFIITQAGADSPPGTKLFLFFFLGVFCFSIYMLLLILQPFVHTLIFACVFAALTHPLYIFLLRYVGQRKPIASFLVVMLLVFLVFLPIYIFIAGLIPQAKTTIALIYSWLAAPDAVDIINSHIQPLLNTLHTYFPEFDLDSVDVSKELRMVLGSMESMLGFGKALLGNTFKIILHLLLMLMIMFFLLMDGAELIRKLEYYCPLKPRQTGVIMDSIRQISKAVLLGGFVIAILQGTAGGIAFAIVGFPAFFWGTVMVMASFIPIVGTWLVWFPGATILFLSGNVKGAIFLVAWGVIVIGGIDNILRPILMRGAANVPILFIFLALFGGLNVFGMLGILYGPLILSFAAVMLTIYGEEYQVILRNRPDKHGQDSIGI